MRKTTVAHTIRTDEKWTLRRNQRQPITVQKATVRVAKGEKGGNRPGTFSGDTNRRGTVIG